MTEPKTNQTKSKQRVADHGEVFTAEREVNAMLDLVKQETERIESRFLEPACGDGNFLSEILKRKLQVVKSRYSKHYSDYERYSVYAVTSIYGVELLQDNVEACRNRLFEIWNTEYTSVCKTNANDECRNAVWFILNHNILCGDALTMQQDNGEPIIFAEWSAVNTHLLKRRDFRLDQMLEGYAPEGLQSGLPFDEKEFTDTKSEWEKDSETGVWIPLPIREFSPIHYRRVQEHE